MSLGGSELDAVEKAASTMPSRRASRDHRRLGGQQWNGGHGNPGAYEPGDLGRGLGLGSASGLLAVGGQETLQTQRILMTCTSPPSPAVNWMARISMWLHTAPGSWAPTRSLAATGSVLLPWRHLDGQPARGRHSGADGGKEQCVDGDAGGGLSSSPRRAATGRLSRRISAIRRARVYLLEPNATGAGIADAAAALDAVTP